MKDIYNKIFIFIGIFTSIFLITTVSTILVSKFIDYRIDEYNKLHMPKSHIESQSHIESYSDYKKDIKAVCHITLLSSNNTILVEVEGLYGANYEVTYPLINDYRYIVTFYNCKGKLIKN